MSVGDSVGGYLDLPAGGVAVIQPTDGTTWLIQNLSITGPFKLALTSTGHAAYGVVSSQGSTASAFMNNLMLYCNSSSFWVVYNTDTVEHGLEYNGIVINDGTNGAIDVNGLFTLTAGQTALIQPPAGQEWEINYVICNGQGTLQWSSSKTIIPTIAQNTWVNGLKLMITNTHYIKVTNTDSETYFYAYAGSRTK